MTLARKGFAALPLVQTCASALDLFYVGYCGSYLPSAGADGVKTTMLPWHRREPYRRWHYSATATFRIYNWSSYRAGAPPCHAQVS